MKVFLSVFTLLLVFSTAGLSQPEGPGKSDKNGCRVEFFNSSIVHGSPLFSSIKLDLHYGKLDIPIKDIVRITSGFHIEDKLQEDINKAIKNLGSVNHADRVVADKYLREEWEFSYTLMKRNKSSDREISKRIEEITDYIEKERDKRLYLKDRFDTIYLRDGSVYKGKIDHQNQKYAFDTKNMGKVESHLGGIRDILFNTSDVREFVLDISKSVDGEWVDSGIYVTGNCKITATGVTDFWPSEVGRYISGPAGAGSVSKDGYLMGTLLVKIGDTTFKAGESVSLTCENTTRLFFRISRPTWGIPEGPSGSYKIRVTNP